MSRAMAPLARSAVAAMGLVVTAVAVDVFLFLQTAGAILRPLEALALAAAAVAAVGLTQWAPRWELIAVPVVAFVVFRLSLGVLIEVPDDAVIRDAQAGLALFVIVGAQLAVVTCGVALANVRGNRSDGP